MTTTESLESLIKNGVSQITIGKPDDRPGMLFASTVHGVPMGAAGNQIVFNHQSVDGNVTDLLQSLAEQVEKAVKLAVNPAIVAMPDPEKRN